MPSKFRANDIAFLVVSNREVREVQILKVQGDMYVVRFVNGGGGLRVRERRLFTTAEDAEASLPKKKLSQSVFYRSPWE